jgi:cytochrome P450
MGAPQVSLLDGAFYADDPYPAFAWLRRNRPVYRDPPSGVWGVTRYHDVKAVATNPTDFSNAGGIRPGQPATPFMVDMDDPEHRRRRRLVGEGFLPKAVAARQPAIGEICDYLIDRVREIALDETLRWVSPIKNMTRTATADTTVGNTRIRAGDTVLLLYPSANRDEDVFDEPESFDITRQPDEHVAFGFGPHFCLGSRVARQGLKEMFSRLLTRLPDLELTEGATIPLPRRPANFVSGIESMPVTFAPERV